jgi:hypothetical protein
MITAADVPCSLHGRSIASDRQAIPGGRFCMRATDKDLQDRKTTKRIAISKSEEHYSSPIIKILPRLAIHPN